MKNGDKSAYPLIDRGNTLGVDTGLQLVQPGLTKREYFAAMAMQGFLAAEKDSSIFNGYELWFVERSIRMADELLKQLEQHNP